MKILFLTHSLLAGGAERATANLANFWVQRGWKVTIATFAGLDLDFYRLDPRVERIALQMAHESANASEATVRNLAKIRAVRNLLEQGRPDVAIGMQTQPSVLLALAGRGLPVVLIGSEQVHPPSCPVKRVWKLLRKLSYGIASLRRGADRRLGQLAESSHNGATDRGDRQSSGVANARHGAEG